MLSIEKEEKNRENRRQWEKVKRASSQLKKVKKEKEKRAAVESASSSDCLINVRFFRFIPFAGKQWDHTNSCRDSDIVEKAESHRSP